jgi:hypothetical protein
MRTRKPPPHRRRRGLTVEESAGSVPALNPPRDWKEIEAIVEEEIAQQGVWEGLPEIPPPKDTI